MPNYNNNRVRLGLIAILALGGCTPDTWKPTHVSSQADVGKLLVTVTSVTPWADIADALQPKFTLSGDDAVKAVLPVIYQAGQTSLSQIGASIQANFPGTSSTSTQTQALTAGAPSAPSTGSKTDSLTAGAPISSPTAPSYPITSVPTLGSLPTLGTDPLLAMQAAKSFFEATVLENREVVNAALRKGYVPYLVRLRLTMQSDRPYLAYNIRSHIAFFSENQYQQQSIPELDSQNYREYENVPVVVPIVATDNIERAMSQQSAAVARAFSAALSGVVQGLSIGGAFSNVAATIDTSAGSDYNTKLSVAREVDNVLSVRIGAALQGHSGRALIDQPYEAATILLVPQSYFIGKDANTPLNLRVFSDSDYIDAESGRQLPDASSNTFLAKVDTAFRQALTSDTATYQKWTELPDACRRLIGTETLDKIRAGSVQKLANYLNSINKFGQNNKSGKNLASDCKKTDGIYYTSSLTFGKVHWATLWSQMAAISGTDWRTSSVLQIPIPGTLQIPDQTLVLVDNGTNPATVTFNGVYGRSISGLVPFIEINSKDANGTMKKYKFAGKLNIDSVNQILTATFPNLSSLFKKTTPEISRIVISNQSCQDGLKSFNQADALKNVLCPTVDMAEFTNIIATPLPDLVQKPTATTLLSIKLPDGVTAINYNKITGLATITLNIAVGGDEASFTATGAAISSPRYSLNDPKLPTLTVAADGHVAISPNFSGIITFDLTLTPATLRASPPVATVKITDHAHSQEIKINLQPSP